MPPSGLDSDPRGPDKGHDLPGRSGSNGYRCPFPPPGAGPCVSRPGPCVRPLSRCCWRYSPRSSLVIRRRRRICAARPRRQPTPPRGRSPSPSATWSPPPTATPPRPAARSCVRAASAVDAAIAVQLVLNLVEPQSLGHRRRRLHALLGRRQHRAHDFRRPRDRARRRQARPLPRPTASRWPFQTAVARRPLGRRAGHLAHDGDWRTRASAACRGRACSSRRSASPRPASRSRRRLHCCCGRAGPESFVPEAPRAISSPPTAAPGPSATCSRIRSSPRL